MKQKKLLEQVLNVYISFINIVKEKNQIHWISYEKDYFTIFQLKSILIYISDDEEDTWKKSVQWFFVNKGLLNQLNSIIIIHHYSEYKKIDINSLIDYIILNFYYMLI